jgi:O-antigen ligase
MLFVSLMLLILSTLDDGPLGSFAKLCWLGSVGVLTLVNVGAAFAVYMGSLCIYAPLHFEGFVSFSQRPDNYALFILLVGLIPSILKRTGGRPKLNRWVLLLVAFSIAHTVIFARPALPSLFRTIIVPLILCECLALLSMDEREMGALRNGMGFLGAYMGLVSILERIPAYGWILPRWVGDPSLRPADPYLEEWIGSGRSGGTLLQPAFSGLVLTLIICLLLPRLRMRGSLSTALALSLCVAGSFFTYTRSVWLGLAFSLLWFPGWCRSPRQAFFRRAALVFGTAILLLAARGMASERIQNTDNILFRLNLWGAGLRLAAAHPVTGVGFFNFASVMHGEEQGFGSVLPSLDKDVQDDVASHNTPLTVLVEFGLIGFLVYSLTFVSLVRRARDNIRGLWGRPGAAWVVAFVIVYFVNAQVVSAFEGVPNTLFLGALGAMAGARTRLAAGPVTEGAV